ncbi:MAG: hypothetical protein CMH64_01435 [Nanoarchaeota archaeon]|nr:hypothetical protein [Nanoarchaeota archaeon]|tara:strand:+ start:674 stop:1189 length:516 start_codon:yes stop_codon:yes gene_type:complete
MVYVCIELIIRAVLEFGKYFFEHWLVVLVFLFIISKITGGLKEKGPLAIGILASALNIGADLLLLGTGGLSVILSVIVGLAIGVLWSGMISFSAAPGILRLINAPLMFIAGFTWGVAEAPIPLGVTIGGLLNWRFTNYLVSFLPSLLIVAFLWFAGATTCSVINSGIQFIS